MVTRVGRILVSPEGMCMKPWARNGLAVQEVGGVGVMFYRNCMTSISGRTDLGHEEVAMHARARRAGRCMLEDVLAHVSYYCNISAWELDGTRHGERDCVVGRLLKSIPAMDVARRRGLLYALAVPGTYSPKGGHF